MATSGLERLRLGTERGEDTRIFAEDLDSGRGPELGEPSDRNLQHRRIAQVSMTALDRGRAPFAGPARTRAADDAALDKRAPHTRGRQSVQLLSETSTAELLLQELNEDGLPEDLHARHRPVIRLEATVFGASVH